jgi:hypothetical protein
MRAPEGAVITQVWLEKQGVYRQLTRRYVTSGWLERFGHGAFKRAGDQVDWLGAVYAIQHQLGINVHVAGETALQLKGLGHFLPLGTGGTVYLLGYTRAHLPTWFTKYPWTLKVRFARAHLFDDTDNVGFSEILHGRLSVRVSAPERAILESIYLASTNEQLAYIHQLMSGLSTMRPDVVQSLLKNCRSYKVKRFFLWSAETTGHGWFKKLNAEHIDLGTGKQQLFKGGVYSAKYRITVPPINEELPRV